MILVLYMDSKRQKRTTSAIKDSFLFTPYINYYSLIWTSTYFSPPRTSPKPLLSKHNILSLHSVYKFYVACFVFSHFNSLLPTPVSSNLHFNSEYHDYMTRSRFNLIKPVISIKSLGKLLLFAMIFR